VVVERAKYPGKRGYSYRWLYYDDGRKREVVPPVNPRRIERERISAKK
jgi:hypothetical protein